MSAASPFFLGIDGGGTSTDLAMLAEDGSVAARLSGETSNKSVVGFDGAVSVLTALIDQACEIAGTSKPIAAGWVGLAGADRPEDRAAFTEALGSRISQLQITNDAELVLSGVPSGVGIALIAGTGSIAFARNERGETGRSGGWGHIFGDEGSAYMVAVDALRAVAAAVDGRGPATTLIDALLAWWEAERPQQLISRIYAEDVRKADIARSAPVVVEAASAGDNVALAILNRAGDDLTDLVHSLARRIPFDEMPAVVGTGGLLLHTDLVRRRIEGRLDPSMVRPDLVVVDDIALSVAQAVRRRSQKGQS